MTTPIKTKKKSSSALFWQAVREVHPRPKWEEVDKKWIDWWRERFERLMVEEILPKVEIMRGSIIAEEAARLVKEEVLTCGDAAKRDAGIYAYERFPFGVARAGIGDLIDAIYQ